MRRPRRPMVHRASLALTAILLAPAVGLAGQQAGTAAEGTSAVGMSFGAFAAADRTAAGRASSSGLRADLSHRRTTRRVSFDLVARSQVRQRGIGGGLWADTQWASATFGSALTERTTLTVSQRLGYSPLYDPGTLAAPTPAADGLVPPGDGVVGKPTITSTSLVRLSRQVTRLSTASAAYGYDLVAFTETGMRVSNHRASLQFDRTVSRQLAMRVQYRSVMASSSTESGLTQDAALGLAYAPASWAGTTITLAVAPNLTTRRSQASPAREPGAPDAGRAFRVGGLVGIDRELNDRWRAGAAYRREIYYLRGTTEPVSADGVSGYLRADLPGSVTIVASVAASSGTPSLQSSRARLTSLGSLLRLDAPLGQAARFHVEYRRDGYTLAGRIPALPDLSTTVERYRFEAGVTVDVGRSGSAGRPRHGRDRKR